MILTTGVVATWFLPRQFTTLVLGLALMGGAVANSVLGVRSELGYTAATLTLLTGAVLAWKP